MSLLTSKTTSTSTTTKNLPPELQGLSDSLSGSIQGTINDPYGSIAPLKAPAMEAINRRYAAAPTRLAAELGKRGFSSSGKAGGAYFDLEKARLGDLSNLEGTLDTAALDQKNNASSLAERLIADRQGSTQTGTQTQNPGIGGLISSGLSALTTMYGLNSILKGGGGGGGGGYTPGGFGGPNGVWGGGEE